MCSNISVTDAIKAKYTTSVIAFMLSAESTHKMQRKYASVLWVFKVKDTSVVIAYGTVPAV